MATLMVTGAARGIGHAVVLRALKRGDDVYAAIRKEEDRRQFTESGNLRFVLMDVADTASVDAGFAHMDQMLAGKPLDAVINSAGISRPNAVEIASVEEFRETLNTNTLGSLRVMKAAIPRLRGHGGRLILLTSLWGRASGPLLGSYCASKHAIESLADSARRETSGMNLHVILVEPGVVKTDMLTDQARDIAGLVARMSPTERIGYEAQYRRYARLTDNAAKTAITAAQCAAVIERALTDRRPRTRYRAGTDAKVMCFLAWLLPDRWMDAVLRAAVNNKPLRSA